MTGCYRRFLYSVIGSFENWVKREVGCFFSGNLGANFTPTEVPVVGMLFIERSAAPAPPLRAFSNTFFLFSSTLFAGSLTWLLITDTLLIMLDLLCYYCAWSICSTACKGKGSRSFLMLSLRFTEIFFSLVAFCMLVNLLLIMGSLSVSLSLCCSRISSLFGERFRLLEGSSLFCGLTTRSRPRTGAPLLLSLSTLFVF